MERPRKKWGKLKKWVDLPNNQSPFPKNQLAEKEFAKGSVSLMSDLWNSPKSCFG
jgi:hypothetical protein